MKWIIRGIIVVVLLLSSFDIGICYIIRDEAGGCECENIGTWSPDTLTCTLRGDVNDIIEIDDDGITLDGNGYSANEIVVFYRNGFIIENFVGASYINIFGINLLEDSDIDPGIIRDNTITGVHDSIDICDGNYIEITDNTISQCSDGIYLSGSSNINITNNTIYDNLCGISCYDSSYNNIIDNTIIDVDDSIDIFDGNYIEITNNIISHCSYGIYLSSSSNIDITNNTIHDNNYCGISCYDSSYNNIIDNTIFDNNECGIYLYMTWDHYISDNTISNNIDDGIWLDQDNDGNTILNNNILDNGGYGIHMEDDREHYIYCNNIFNNDCGIYILNSVDNTLYYNNLVDNAINNGYESLESGSNEWYNNHWSDYDESCVDDDDDGICDSPYDIPGGSGVDYYPLLSSPQCCSPDWCEIYDTNGMDGIQKDEAVNAINDYLIFHTINKEATVAVLNCYFGL